MKSYCVEIETENKENGIIEYQDISWTKIDLDKLFNRGTA